jgi:hypothetical protein
VVLIQRYPMGSAYTVVDHLQTGGPYTEVYHGDPWVQPIQWWTTYRQVVLIQRYLMGSAYTVVDHLQTGGPYTEVSHGFSLYSGGPPTDRWSLYRGIPWGVYRQVVLIQR